MRRPIIRLTLVLLGGVGASLLAWWGASRRRHLDGRWFEVARVPRDVNAGAAPTALDLTAGDDGLDATWITEDADAVRVSLGRLERDGDREFLTTEGRPRLEILVRDATHLIAATEDATEVHVLARQPQLDDGDAHALVHELDALGLPGDRMIRVGAGVRLPTEPVPERGGSNQPSGLRDNDEQALMDLALDGSFPASDPPSFTRR